MRVAVVASAQIFGGFQNLPPPQSLDFSAFFGLSHLFPPRLSISVIFDTDLVTSHEEPYQTPERAQREVYYAGKEELLMNIKKSLYSQPQPIPTPKADGYMSSYGEK